MEADSGGKVKVGVGRREKKEKEEGVLGAKRREGRDCTGQLR